MEFLSVLFPYPVIGAMLVSYLVLTGWFFMAKSRITTPEHARSYTVDASEMVLTPRYISEYAG